MADFLVLRGPGDSLPLKYKDMGDGTVAPVVYNAGVGGGGIGDASAANQTAVTGSKAPGTAAASSLLVGGVYLSTPPTLTNGQQASLQFDVNGQLKIVGSISGAGDASAANQTAVQGVIGAATAPAKMAVSGGVYNSTPLTLTNGQSSAFQFDANGFLKTSGAVTGLAQGSTTSGQTGNLSMGAVTTAAPTYTNAQTSPLSLTPAGALRVLDDNSASQSALITSTNTYLNNLTGTKAPGTAAANSALVGGVYNSTPPTLTNGQQASLQFDVNGQLKIVGTISGAGDASAANQTAVQGVIGAATAPAKMAVGGGVYNSTPITLTNGQSSAFQHDANGYLKVNVATATGVAQGSTTSGQTISPVGGAVTTAAPTYVTGQTSPLSLDTNGALRVNVTAGGAGGGAVEGVAAHDAVSTGADPVLIGGYAKAAAPADVSADADAVNAWFLRNGSQVIQLAAAGALLGGDVTNGLDVDITRMAALVAGSALIGNVGHGKTIKSAGFSLTADGDLIALVSTKRIKVIAYYFSKAGTTASIYNIRTNNVTGTILAKIQLQSQAGAVMGANLSIAAPSFLFASAAGEALYLDVPDAEAVTGFITYFDDDAT